MVWDLGRQLLGLLVLLFVAFRLFKPAIATVLKTADQPALGGSAGGNTLAVENSQALPAPAGATNLQAMPGAMPQAQVPAQLGPDGQPAVHAQGEFMDPNAITPGMVFEDKLGSVRQAVTQDPAKVAQVVKGWLASE
jgi:flagellar biosynthesis/type III secretory pathway M-ring protein FliF/YscJ